MNNQNDQLVLICGASSTGKSASLRNIKDQPKWLFINAEAGKALPFKNSFRSAILEDPLQVLSSFDYACEHPDDVNGIIIDSLTFMMDMFESRYVLTASNTLKAWSDYNQFFKAVMQDKVLKFNKPTIFTAHTLRILNESTGEYECSVPIKGALKGQGIEAYFSTIVATKKVPLKELAAYKNDLLHITEEEEILGFKYCFQTKITKNTIGERIRSPMGLFTREQTFIDNDAQLLLDHLKSFYS